MTSRAGTAAIAPARRALERGGAAGALRSIGAPLLLVAAIAAATLAWWLDGVAVLATPALVAAFALPGLLLVRSARLEAPSALAMGALALVVAVAVVVFAVLLLALVGAPIAPATVGGAAALMAAGAVAIGRVRAMPAAESETQAPIAHAATYSPRVVVVSLVLSAAALLLLPSLLHQIALAAVAGVLAWLLWDGASTRDDAPTGRDRDDSGLDRLARRVGEHGGLIVAGALGLLLVTRLVPFLRSPVPLGYDTGLYRGVQRDFVEALPALPSFAANSWGDVQPAGLYVITDLLHLAGASSDAALWGLLILAQVIGALGVWLLGHELGGRRVASWALVLFVLSSAQFVLFQQVYFKQALALALLPYVLWLWRRESWLVVPVGALLAATHTMGFLLMGLVLLSDTLWPDRPPGRGFVVRAALAARSYRLSAGAAIFALGLAAYAFAPGALGEVLSTDLRETLARFGIGGEAGAGSFRVDSGYYAVLVLPLVPFAALTLARCWRDPRWRLVVLWAGWAGAFVLLQLIFGRRFIGSLDPAFALLAAGAIASLTSGALRRAATPLVAVALLASAFFLVRTVADLGPEITVADLRDVESVSRTLPPEAYLMAVSSADMPWVRGYGERDAIAPGFLEHDRWTRDQWLTFWGSPDPTDRYALLAQYDRPIYVFMRADAPLRVIATDPQFERVSRTLWQYHPPSGAP